MTQIAPFYSLQADVSFLAIDGTGCEVVGDWEKPRFTRSTSFPGLLTFEPDASVTCRFEGEWVAVMLPPCAGWPGTRYGILRGLRGGCEYTMKDAELEVELDGRPCRSIPVGESPLEVLIATALAPGQHELRCRFALAEGACGGVSGFVVGRGGPAQIAVKTCGDYEDDLNTVRLSLARDGELVHTKIGRNPLSGAAAVTVVQDGTHALRIEAEGWETYTSDVDLEAGCTTDLGSVYLRRRQPDGVCEDYGLVRPRRGQTASVAAGGKFPALVRAQGGAEPDTVVGAALVAGERRVALTIAEDRVVEQYSFEHELSLCLPTDTPTGMYDLEVDMDTWRHVAPAAVMVRDDSPERFRIVFLGHTNTWEQATAEYLRRMTDLINLLNPLFVVVSNEVNGAYLTGALSGLRMPCFVTPGNHSYPDFSKFWGAEVAAYDCGPARILNFGQPWCDEWRHAVHLFEDRPDAGIRIINAYEPNAPVEELLDRCGVGLLCAGHSVGAGEYVGQTPTLVVGKADSNSFRIVEVSDGVPTLVTCPDGPRGAFPVPRGEPSPLRVFRRGDEAEIINEYGVAFEGLRPGVTTDVGPRTRKRVELPRRLDQ